MSTSPIVDSPGSQLRMGIDFGVGGGNTNTTRRDDEDHHVSPTSPRTPNSAGTIQSTSTAPQISFPALHLGSFHSLSLKDFGPRLGSDDGKAVGGMDVSGEGGTKDGSPRNPGGGSYPNTQGEQSIFGKDVENSSFVNIGIPPKIPSTSTQISSAQIRYPSVNVAANVVAAADANNKWTLPITREVTRRLTVVERPLTTLGAGTSLPFVRSSSDGSRPVDHRIMTRESESAELGMFPSSSGTSMIGASQTNSGRGPDLQVNVERTSLQDDWRGFPTPPSREDLLPPTHPLELPIRQQSTILSASPTESPTTSAERKKRRLPSTPVGKVPGQRSVSSPVWTSRGPERSQSDPEPGIASSSALLTQDEGTRQSSVQAMRASSVPRSQNTAAVMLQPPIRHMSSFSPLASHEKLPTTSMQSLGSAANWPDNVEIHHAQVGQVGFVDGYEPGPSRIRQVEVDQIARNSFDRPSAIPMATPKAHGGLSGMPAYLAMDMSGGPYPSYNRPSVEVAQQQQKASPSRPLTGAPLKVKLPPPQEEICLECLMRDRDLIHVDVMTDGVWERASDADWREMLEREREWEWDVEQAQAEGYLVADSDADFFRAVPWRGFVWEEEDGEAGLPEGFRGRDGGMLLEGELKALGIRMGSPSSHRARTLRKYLDDQAALLDPVALQLAQAQPTGRTFRPNMQQDVAAARLEPVRDVAPGARHTMYDDNPSYYDPQRDIEERIARDRAQANRMREASTGSQSRMPMFDVNEPMVIPRSRFDAAEQARALRVPSTVQQLHERKGRGISSPGLIETGAPDDRRYPDMDNSWSMDPSSSARLDEQVTPPIRPFSFAVWAGRNGDPSGAYSARSSPGPRPGSRYDEDGRSVRSGQGGFFGRWGGSVTSFFGGSQGGVSGSMMDMHLGLDADRRYAAGPHTDTHARDRAVSMASLPRPRFFSRNSRASSFLYDGELGKNNDAAAGDDNTDYIVPPPTSTVQPYDERKQKKGLKGFFAKFGGGKKKRSQTHPVEERPSYREEDYATTPLAPPPPLSYLVDRSDRQPQHKRTPSGGSGDLSSSVAAAQIPSGASDYLQQSRSVSAPLMNSSSSGSLPSVSPTSSRFYPGGGVGRESYASQGSKRRSSGPLLGVREGKLDSGVEVLEPDTRWEEPVIRYGRALPSLTDSSGTLLLPSVESPGLGLRPPQQQHVKLGDKQKMLPPLPGDISPSSPDSFNAYFGDQYTYDERADPRQGLSQGGVGGGGGGGGSSQFVRHTRQASAGQASHSSGRSSSKEARRTRSKFGLKALFGAEGRRSGDGGGEGPRELSADGPRYRQTYYQ